MSADNWAICPRCLDRAKAERAAQATAAASGYGKISADEYERLRAAAQTPVDPESFRTFREDHEFSGAAKGTITANYSGHCSVCGLQVSFKYEQWFYEQDDL